MATVASKDQFPKPQPKPKSSPPSTFSRQDQLVYWLRTHQRRLRSILVGGGVVALCFIVFFLYRARQYHYGLSEFDLGLMAFNKKEYSKAISHLEQASRSLSKGIESRNLSLFYLGEIYRAEKQLDKATASYSAAISESKDIEQSYISQIVLLQLGRLSEIQGQFSEAAKWYEKAKDLNGPLRSQILFAYANVMEKSGNSQIAKSIYREFGESYSDSPLFELAKERGE